METKVGGKNLTIDDFLDVFPEFTGMTQRQFNSSYYKSFVYVDPHSCPAGWNYPQYKLAVMLAMAHVFYKTPFGQDLIDKNGYDASTIAGGGNIIMASEGSVSVMKKVYTPKNATENDLITSVYGEELLALYEGINPPLTGIEPAPYYPTGYDVGGWH